MQAFTTMEPGSKLNGFQVRELLLSHKKIDPIALEMLFEADRAEHTGHVKRMLDQGNWIISDRCYFSGLAYGLACGHRHEFLHDLLEVSVQVKPDLVVILNIPPSMAADRRSTETREEAKGTGFQELVAKHYTSFPGSLPDFLKVPTLHLNAMASVEALHAEIWERVLELWEPT